MKILRPITACLYLLPIMLSNFVSANEISKLKAFPARHGKVSSQLFLATANNQPLIVGLGGSEGGNPWASAQWKAQRDKFVAQGYVFLALGFLGPKKALRNWTRFLSRQYTMR